MKNNTVVYVEGIPASGKTTIINRLLGKFNRLIDIVPEYVDSREGKRAEITHDPNYFIKNDEAKWQLSQESNKKFVFVDRGHLSTVIYNLVEVRIKKNIDRLKILDWYFDSILGKNRLPSYYILLQADPLISLKRREKFFVSHNIWDYQESLEFANDYYIKFLESYETTVPKLIIQANKLSLNQIEDKIVEHFDLK